MPLSAWLSCAFISCIFCLGSSSRCFQQSDCVEKHNICCDGRCVRRASCRGCSENEQCDTFLGERCEQARCTAKVVFPITVPTALCSTAEDCDPESCCVNGQCTRKQRPCTADLMCYSDGECDIFKGESCVKQRCVTDNTVCHFDSDCRAGEKCDRRANQQICVNTDDNEDNGMAKEKITGITVFVVVGLAMSCTYALCKRRRRTPSSTREGTTSTTSTTGGLVVIDLERPIPFSLNAPPSYDSLAIDSNHRNHEPEPAPPSYEDAIRNSTNNIP